MTTAPNGELRRQDFHLQVQQLVSLRSLLWVHLLFMNTLLVQWSSHRATRCTAMRGALGVPWRTCDTDDTSPCTARAARRVRAGAIRQGPTVDPEGWYHSRSTQRWKPTPWSPMGEDTARSLPRAS